MGTPVFDKLRQLNLRPNGYAIFGSGPLVIRGIIPYANDLDVLCHQDVWELISSIGTTEFLPAYDVTVAKLFGGAVTFGTRWGIGDFDVGELIETAEVIDALPFVRLEHVICYKKIRSSEKDLRHLGALKASGYQ